MVYVYVKKGKGPKLKDGVNLSHKGGSFLGHWSSWSHNVRSGELQKYPRGPFLLLLLALDCRLRFFYIYPFVLRFLRKFVHKRTFTMTWVTYTNSHLSPTDGHVHRINNRNDTWISIQNYSLKLLMSYETLERNLYNFQCRLPFNVIKRFYSMNYIELFHTFLSNRDLGKFHIK